MCSAAFASSTRASGRTSSRRSRSGGPTTIGTMAHFEGVLLTQTAVTVQAGATMTGRLLSQTSVTIDGSTVVAP